VATHCKTNAKLDAIALGSAPVAAADDEAIQVNRCLRVYREITINCGMIGSTSIPCALATCRHPDKPGRQRMSRNRGQRCEAGPMKRVVFVVGGKIENPANQGAHAAAGNDRHS